MRSKKGIKKSHLQIKIKPNKRKKRQSLSLSKIDWEKVEKIFTHDKKVILQSLKHEEKRFPYTSEVLKLLAAGAIIGLSFAFPMLPVAIAPFIVDSDRYQRHRLNQTIKRLKRQKLVEIVEKEENILVKITKDGRIRALQYKFEEMKIDKPKVWDRKWRIVIFDIPEKARQMRDVFRLRLKMLGFYNLQESVWVHPYPCFDQVEFLREIYNIGINVRYIIADRIEEAENLLHHFDLH